MKLSPGSFLWLLAHDQRLTWRGLTAMFVGWSKPASIVAVVAGLVGLHALAWGALSLRTLSPEYFTRASLATAATGIALWMIAQGLLGGTRSLYERSDLDVLFASPLPVWKAVTSRALAITGSSLAAVAPLLMPLANAGTIREGANWLALYPIIVSMALAATAVGFILAVGLFAIVGPRRARLISQILAALIAGAFVLGVQVAAILPRGVMHQVWAAVSGVQGALLEVAAPLWAPAFAAATGDAGALLALLTGALVIFGAAVVTLSGTFARATLTAAGSADAARAGRDRPFQAGVQRALRIKEWRLLIRDHNLVAQIGLQIIYTLPIAVVLLRSPQDIPPAIALAPLIVVLAAQLAASLSWITVSGEDAPELIATAPVPAIRATAAKLSAIALPVAVILAAPLLTLALISPLAAVLTVAFGAAAGASTALLNVWHPMPGNRRGMLRRHSQSKVIAIAEHGVALLWAVAIVATFFESKASLVPVGLVAIVLLTFRPKRLVARHS